MSDLGSLLTGRPLIGFVMAYAVFPYAVLWLAVRCWPADDRRRAEYLAEYDYVPWYQRPLWVGDVAVRCLLDGWALRNKGWCTRRAIRVAATRPVAPAPSPIWLRGAKAAGIPPLCVFIGSPVVIVAAEIGNLPALALGLVSYLAGAGTLHVLWALVFLRRLWAWERAVARLAAQDVASQD